MEDFSDDTMKILEEIETGTESGFGFDLIDFTPPKKTAPAADKTKIVRKKMIEGLLREKRRFSEHGLETEPKKPRIVCAAGDGFCVRLYYSNRPLQDYKGKAIPAKDEQGVLAIFDGLIAKTKAGFFDKALEKTATNKPKEGETNDL